MASTRHGSAAALPGMIALLLCVGMASTADASATTAAGCAEPQFILNQPGVAGQPFQFSGAVECLPGGDTYSNPVIEWGDGTTSPGAITSVDLKPGFSGSVSVSAQHIYGQAGEFCIRARLTDEESGQTVTGAWHTCAHVTAAGGAPVAPGPVTPPGLAPPGGPVLSGLRTTARTWREGNALAQTGAETRTPLGMTISFSLNMQAFITLKFISSASPQRHSGPSGTLSFHAHAGTNTVRFEGRISKRRKLKPGRYKLIISARASGRHSASRSLRFTILG
jgi:hypothetical protein